MVKIEQHTGHIDAWQPTSAAICPLVPSDFLEFHSNILTRSERTLHLLPYRLDRLSVMLLLLVPVDICISFYCSYVFLCSYWAQNVHTRKEKVN